MGGWTGSGEERDNKAGGDVNSQIGSFSCFPQPATLDGWLRQRPERIRETQAPPEGWLGRMEEGAGAAGAGLGSVGRVLPRAARKGMTPGNWQLLGKPKENCTHCLHVSPVCNLWAPRQHQRVENRGACPLWVTRSAKKLSPVGLGMLEGR